MKFTCSVEIERPIDTVVHLFDNPENVKHWQKGFVSTTHISGTPGSAGAKSEIVFNSGKRVIELTETIQVKNLPNEMTALYEHKHMVNTMSNYFTPLSPNRTKWVVVIDYTKFIGLMPKLMALLFPRVFRKQTQESLDRFKVFAEES